MLFHSISEGDIIRTTPIQSPRLSRFLPMPAMGSSLDKQLFAIKDTTPGQVSERTESGDDVRSDNQTTPADDRDPRSDVAEAPLAAQNKGKGKAVHRPPPILKGSRTGSSKQQAKTARILTPTWKSDTREQESDDEVISPTTSMSAKPEGKPSAKIVAPSSSDEGQSDDGSHSPTAQPKKSVPRTPLPGPSKTDVNPSVKVGKKKSAFVASTASTKRRPTTVRRKSSQSSSSNSTSKVPSPHLPSQSVTASPPPLPNLPSPRVERNPVAHPSGIRSSNFPALSESPPDFAQSTKARSSRTSRSASPTTSRPFQDSSLGALSPPRGSVDATEAPPLQDWLVDRDFRAKFVDRSHTSTLPTNRAAASSSSTPQPIPSQGDGSGQAEGKGKGKTPSIDYIDSIVPLKPPGAESSAIEDDDEDEPSATVLPRTKSQLTLLVENERKRESEKRGKQRRGNRGRNN